MPLHFILNDSTLTFEFSNIQQFTWIKKGKLVIFFGVGVDGTFAGKYMCLHPIKLSQMNQWFYWLLILSSLNFQTCRFFFTIINLWFRKQASDAYKWCYKPFDYLCNNIYIRFKFSVWNGKQKKRILQNHNNKNKNRNKSTYKTWKKIQLTWYV